MKKKPRARQTPKLILEQRANKKKYKPTKKVRRVKAIFACEYLRALYEEFHFDVPESGATKRNI